MQIWRMYFVLWANPSPKCNPPLQTSSRAPLDLLQSVPDLPQSSPRPPPDLLHTSSRAPPELLQTSSRAPPKQTRNIPKSCSNANIKQKASAKSLLSSHLKLKSPWSHGLFWSIAKTKFQNESFFKKALFKKHHGSSYFMLFALMPELAPRGRRQKSMLRRCSAQRVQSAAASPKDAVRRV